MEGEGAVAVAVESGRGLEVKEKTDPGVCMRERCRRVSANFFPPSPPPVLTSQRHPSRRELLTWQATAQVMYTALLPSFNSWVSLLYHHLALDSLPCVALPRPASLHVPSEATRRRHLLVLQL